MKRSIAFFLFLFFLLNLTACAGNGGSGGHVHSFGEWAVVRGATDEQSGLMQRACSCGKTESKTVSVGEEHDELKRQIGGTDRDTPYSDLYALYRVSVAHNDNCECDLDLSDLLKNMFYGKWVHSSGKYITFRYISEDYNDTKGTAWYGTGLTTSQAPGRSYYYYTRVEGGTLIIGYQDRETEEQTDNYLITFRENGIAVWNNNDDTEYLLERDGAYVGVVKGNAKLAYAYINRLLSTLDHPESIREVFGCNVDYDEQTVCVSLLFTDKNANGSSTNRKEDYKLYERDGRFCADEYEYSSRSNIDLTEMTQMIVYPYKYLLPSE